MAWQYNFWEKKCQDKKKTQNPSSRAKEMLVIVRNKSRHYRKKEEE